MPLREYSEAEILDFAYRLRDVEWGTEPSSQIIPTLPDDIQHYIFNEIQRSKIDFEYWCSRYAMITDDRGRLSPLRPWPSQRAILERLAGMEEEEWDWFQAHPEVANFQCRLALALLKSRQVGGTAISEALVTHLTIFFPHTRSVIGSDHPDTSLKLFRVMTGMLDNLPGWMKPITDARVKATNLHFPELNSDVIVGSGNQKTTLGQGMTVDACHLTEVSTWEPENALALDYDLNPAFQSSRRHHALWILESTGAGGKGNWFHDQYQAAASGKGFFKHLFIGWFMCPDKFSQRTEGVTLRPDILRIGERIRSETGIECTKEQLTWYQGQREYYEAKGELEVCLQEFPCSAEEAFQTGLRSVFPIEIRSVVRSKCRDPIAVYEVNTSSQKLRPVSLEEWLRSDDPEKANEKLLIWELARPGYVYVVGVDASYAADGGDSSAIEVLRVGNRNAPDEQVAEWRGKIPPSELHIPCWIIGHVYTDKEMQLPAKMAVECNPGSPGIVCQTDLMRRGYPHFYVYRRPLRQGGGWSNEVGWWTTPATRPALVEGGKDAIMKGELLINSLGTVEEMGSFVITMTPGGRRTFEHAPGYHDDRLIALFIALYVGHEGDMKSIADERRKAWEQRNKSPEKVVQFQALGISWDQAMEKWEDSLGLYS